MTKKEKINEFIKIYSPLFNIKKNETKGDILYYLRLLDSNIESLKLENTEFYYRKLLNIYSFVDSKDFKDIAIHEIKNIKEKLESEK